MVAVEWDKIGARTYQGGIDRGVVYLPNGTAVPWNGLTSVGESTTLSSQPQYMEGRKISDRQIPGDYTAKLTAFTYPDELDEVMGIAQGKEGMSLHDQPTQMLSGISYRTRIGNDVDGQLAGYKLHVIYNVSLIPGDFEYDTLGDKASASEFGWVLTATPVVFPNRRPTAHISFSTSKMDRSDIRSIEDVLYGTASANGRLPQPTDLLNVLEGLYAVKDNGDGTFTISGSESRIRMVDDTTYNVDPITATPVDDDSYTIDEEV